MKATFELSIDGVGRPCIKFMHLDKDNSLEQKLLGLFVKGASEHGCEIINPSGYLESGTPNSWENYQIQIKQP